MEHHISNEKFSSSNWKSGLDQLSCLPAEEKQDMNAAWDKLSIKLDLKKGSRKFIGYWIAAASVAVFILVMFITSKNNEPATQELVKNNQPFKKTESKKTLIKQAGEPVIKDLVKDKSLPAAKNKITNLIPKPLIKVPDTLFQIAVQHEDSLVIGSITVPVLPNKPVTFPVLKKKLPMVHINDIDKPLDPGEVVAGNNEHSGLRIRLFNRDIHMESPASNNENNNALKIKLSPQN